MDFLGDLFSDQSYFVALLLVLLDGILIVCFVLLWSRRSNLPEGSDELKEKLQGLIDEMNRMTGELSSNLEERMNIVQRMIEQLDAKIAEADRRINNLEQAKQTIRPVASPRPAPPRGNEADQVLSLAQRGLDAGAIAQRLQKPLGEVELILNLQKLTLESH